MIHTLSQEQFLPISLAEAWGFFSSPANLDEITPDELGFKTVYQPGDKIYEGQIIEYKVMVAPLLWVPWVTEIKCVKERQSFIDEQRFLRRKLIPGASQCRIFRNPCSPIQ